MPYNNIIDRTGAEALIPEEVVGEVFKAIPPQSKLMQLARRLPNMSRKQLRLKVLDALPYGYFVNGDTGLKQTSEQAWANKYVTAEEVAVVVPIPEAVLADSDTDIFAEVTPEVASAFGKVIDAAVFVGTNAPSSWPDDLLTAATAASHVLDYSTHIATEGNDMYSALLGESGIISLLEADGFMATGFASVMAMRGKLRDARDGVGQPLFKRSMSNGQNMQDSTRYELDGAPIEFFNNAAVAATTALMFAAQWDQIVWSMRQDMTVKLFTEGVVTDNSGNIIYNLMQQDMVALRFVMRMGWQCPNPVTRMNETEATRFPVSVLVP